MAVRRAVPEEESDPLEGGPTGRSGKEAGLGICVAACGGGRRRSFLRAHISLLSLPSLSSDDPAEHVLEHLACSLSLFFSVQEVGVDAEGDLA